MPETLQEFGQYLLNELFEYQLSMMVLESPVAPGCWLSSACARLRSCAVRKLSSNVHTLLTSHLLAHCPSTRQWAPLQCRFAGLWSLSAQYGTR